MITTPNLQLIPCDLKCLEAILSNKKRLARLLQITVPGGEGWPHFPDAYRYSYENFRADLYKLGWWTYLFIHAKDRALVGSGGFKGKPDFAGVVEVGYEIVPEYRNRGFATEATQGFIDFAFSHPEVQSVDAHTLPEPNASTKVLGKVGMKFMGALYDPEDGEVWHWRLPRESYEKGKDA
ncbi:MAG TPA: GNAT family N-acetyltransferase [Blastocatellia bacterium]|nr:GNAT family N-acetyltransferase [Blastocatellia bacterium]